MLQRLPPPRLRLPLEETAEEDDTGGVDGVMGKEGGTAGRRTGDGARAAAAAVRAADSSVEQHSRQAGSLSRLIRSKEQRSLEDSQVILTGSTRILALVSSTLPPRHSMILEWSVLLLLLFLGFFAEIDVEAGLAENWIPADST